MIGTCIVRNGKGHFTTGCMNTNDECPGNACSIFTAYLTLDGIQIIQRIKGKVNVRESSITKGPENIRFIGGFFLFIEFPYKACLSGGNDKSQHWGWDGQPVQVYLQGIISFVVGSGLINIVCKPVGPDNQIKWPHIYDSIS